jgi:hypothetical protein
MWEELFLMGAARTSVSAATRVGSQSQQVVYSFIYLFFPKGYGGYGFTSRKWGLTLDTIQSLEVVLANGTIVTVSLTNHPDLFFVSI